METPPEVNPALQPEIDDLNAQISEAESEIALNEEIMMGYYAEMLESLDYPPTMDLPKYTKEEVEWAKKFRKSCSSEQAVYDMPPPGGGSLDLSRPMLGALFSAGLKIGELKDRIKELRKKIEELLGISDSAGE
ncbi:MAG: hypothetical protein K9G39_01550 [Chlorobium sp.]|uniref:hypothetical protein n=1 Tax=Chlorobium sp. TaxID=1095 RepID=UPI0025C4DF17|nr:hypothetical protein [Chlorobium sp.]MCF8382269.1 hypothetical protein [Chlorobium sp.]